MFSRYGVSCGMRACFLGMGLGVECPFVEEVVLTNFSCVFFCRYGTGSFDFSRLIKASTAQFNTEEMKTQVSIEF